MTEKNTFFRRYEVSIGKDTLVAEFDYGFLYPSHMVFQVHNHAAYECIVVAEGMNTIDTFGNTYQLCGEGNMLIIPKGLYHGNRKTAGENAKRFCFRFYPKTQLRETTEWKGLLKPLGVFLSEMTCPEMFSDANVFLSILSRIQQEFLNETPSGDAMISALLQEWIILFLRRIEDRCMVETVPHARTTMEAARLKMIDRFFSANYQKSVTLGDLANALYMSPTQTNRILVRNYGESFREKLRDTRLHQARFLLESTDMPVYAIAQEVGYGSSAAFFSAFRRMFGMTPAEYRAKNVEE